MPGSGIGRVRGGVGVDEQAGDRLDVLVATAREVEDDQGPGFDPALLGGLGEPADRVGRLERREQALGAGEEAEAVEGEGVGGVLVGDPAGVLPEGVLGADARVVEAGRDRVGGQDLAVGVLEDVGAGAVEDPGLAEAEGGAVVAGPGAAAAGLDPPPTQATARSGRRPSAARIWARASSPMTRWNSRTISGNGWGPTTEPIE